MKSFIKYLPFVSRGKHNQTLRALEDSTRENKRAIVAMFQLRQAYEKRILEETRDVYDLFLGKRWEFGGCKFRVKS